jgi:hypothetical protein
LVQLRMRSHASWLQPSPNWHRFGLTNPNLDSAKVTVRAVALIRLHV